jgi:hypothetical protein
MMAPTGNPLVKPMATTREQQPGSLNRGRITGSNRTPINTARPLLIMSSALIKKGKRAGRSTDAHSFIPSIAAAMVSRGFISIKRVNIKTSNRNNTRPNIDIYASTLRPKFKHIYVCAALI